MATPLKSLSVASSAFVRNVLSPNLLSAISPNKACITPKRSARSLDFSLHAPKNDDNRLGVVQKNTSSPFIKEKPENFLLNTPYKSDLMKNGLCEKRKVDILGKGSFGIVIKGIYKNKIAAAKIIKLNKLARVNDINAQNFSHKNIVKINEINLKPSTNYAVIIMEYLANCVELNTILESDCELDRKKKTSIISNICEGLQYCHGKGVLHLDIKPKNLLIINGNHCKICDFGNSYNIFENPDNYEFQGTVAYAAPELLKGEKPTTKCDIFSLGITIWQMEHKKIPYKEWSSQQSVVYNVVKKGLRPELTTKNVLTDLAEKCWIENPICRPDLDEIFEFLKKC